jgi:hypothetical protein
LIRKKDIENKYFFVHPRVLNVLSLFKHHQFVSNFKNWNFASNGTNFRKTLMWSKLLYFHYDFFQKYRIIVLSIVHPLRWFVRLWCTQWVKRSPKHDVNPNTLFFVQGKYKGMRKRRPHDYQMHSHTRNWKPWGMHSYVCQVVLMVNNLFDF